MVETTRESTALYNLTAVLAQVKVAEALSVYKLMDILATKLRMDEIVSSAGNVAL